MVFNEEIYNKNLMEDIKLEIRKEYMGELKLFLKENYPDCFIEYKQYVRENTKNGVDLSLNVIGFLKYNGYKYILEEFINKSPKIKEFIRIYKIGFERGLEQKKQEIREQLLE